MDNEVLPVDREARNACIRKVINVLPDVCGSYVMATMRLLGCGPDADAIINHLVDEEEAGQPYQRTGTVKDHKRKRTADEDEAEEEDRLTRAYLHPDRSQRMRGKHHVDQIRNLINQDFPQVPAISIMAAIAKSRDLLFPAYIAVYEMFHKNDDGNSRKTRPRVPAGRYAPDTIDQTIQASTNPEERELLAELQHARRIVAVKERTRRTELEAKREDRENFAEHQAKGLVKECECCFLDFAENRLVCCNGEVAHWFCYTCAYNQAKALSGLSRYQLTCMSTDGCEAEFSHSERCKFLDPKLAKALDEIEQEAVLRLSDIEGLVHCPFCPFAAVCGPVTEDKEFRCQSSECQKVSCRLCREETHIPMSCEEAKGDRQTFSARRTIEEARSDALIRKCNKCSTPFIKEYGCNKMRCPRAGCHNLQCYVCSENCSDYGHFNDAARGGRKENCPLFDDSETRHARDADNAEQVTLKKMTVINPDIDLELIRYRMSDDVNRDDEVKRRRLEKEKLNQIPPPAPAPRPAQPVPRQPAQRPLALAQAQQRARAVNQRIERQIQEQNAREALRLAQQAQQPPPRPHWLQYIPRADREGAVRSWTKNLPFLGGAAHVARANNVPPPPPRRQPRRAAAARQVLQDLLQGARNEHHNVPQAARARPANQVAPAGQAPEGMLPQGQRPLPAAGLYRLDGGLQQRQRAQAPAQHVAAPMAHAAAGNVAAPAAPILAPEIRRFPASQQEWDSMYRRGLLPRQQNPPAPGYTGHSPWLTGYGITHLPPWRLPDGYVADPATGNVAPHFPPGAILYGNGGVWYGEPSNMRQIGKDVDRNA